MNILVTGASGLIGRPLVSHLQSKGHTVVSAVRRQPRDASERRWDPATGHLDENFFDGINAVIHLAGAGIGDKRWSDSYKREILESRTKGTRLLAEGMARAANRPTVFLSGSAIGIYGARGDERLDETSTHGSDFLADVCEQWEAAAAPARDAGIRTVFLRTGIVLSKDGGALKKQLPIFQLGAGGRFGDGRHWQSWIAIDDEIGAIEHLLTSTLSGPVNLTAPNPVTNADFTKTLAKVLRRPSLLPIPSFGPKLLLGTELAKALLFTGQRVEPAALQRDGFTFRYTTLEAALRGILGK